MTDRNLGTHTAHWQGVVVNVMDPDKAGRVQVRVKGRHDDTTNIPDKALPWAQVLQPVTSAALGRIGVAPVGLMKGSQVIGVWWDKDYQIPVVLGSMGKAGNLQTSQNTDGIPAVDINYGSMPAYGHGSKYSNYTKLNPNRPSILAINAGLANINNVIMNAGVIFTESVQKLLQIPLVPTIGSLNKTLTLDVLKLVQKADPSYQASVLKCFVPNLLKINSMNIMSGIAQMLAGALVGALLALANKLGLLKLLGMINQALSTAAAVLGQAQQIMSMINSLASAACLPTPLNQNALSAPIQAMASAMYALNSAVGWVAGVANNPISAAAYSAVNGLLSDHSSIQPKPASAPTLTSAVPTPIVDTPPDNFIQVYYQDEDPYPGYIEWEDPDNVLPKVYTLRKEEPMYSSPEEHTHHVMQNHLSTGIEQMASTGSISIQGLVGYMESASALGQVFAASRVLGAGASKLSSVAMLAFALPTLAKLINSVFAPPRKKSKMKTDTTDKPVDDAAKDQSELEQRMKKLRVASQSSSSPLPTPPIPPEAGGATPATTEVPTTSPDINSMIGNAEPAQSITTETFVNPAGVPLAESPEIPGNNVQSNILDALPTGQLPPTNRFRQR